MSISNKAAIVGAGLTNELGLIPDKPAIMLHAESAMNALEDAGLSISDVDGICTAGFAPYEIAEYMGFVPRFTDGTAVGGSSFVIHVGHAAMAIATGKAEVVLITHGESGRSRVGQPGRAMPPDSLRGQFEAPWGLPQPVGAYAMAASRHMAKYGTTKEHLASVAVAAWKWAQHNPKALYYGRGEITAQDVFDSPVICWPFNRHDVCLVTDGGGSLVMTSAERAKDLKQTPVLVKGAGESHDHAMISAMPDFTSFAAKVSGAEAMKMAGVTHDDLDLAMIYDSFTYTVLVTLEALGFCGPGEAGDFVSGGRIEPGGDFPMNTSGGGLAYTHTGMYGMFALIEGVQQLRREFEAPRQVEDIELALVHGTGGLLSSAGTVILERG
ncbi:MAG: acetyl-CoA acetyltransferase [Thermomicrobiales bacterium]